MDSRLRLPLIALAGIMGILGMTAVGLRALHSGAVLPGVSAAGVDLGGLSPQEATAALESLADDRREAPITAVFEDQRFELRPGDFGYEIAIETVVDTAFGLGRNGNLLGDTWRHLTATFGGSTIVVAPDSIDDAMLSERIEALAAEVDQDPGIGDLVGDPVSLRVEAVPPSRGLVVDREAVADLLRSAAGTDGPTNIDLPVAVQEPSVPLAAVESAARRAEAAIPAGLTLFDGDKEVVLTPAQLAGMVTVRSDGPDDVQLDARSADVERAFGESTGLFEVAAVDATFAVARDPGVVLDAKGAVTWEPRPASIPITPSTPGQTFDADLTARQIGDLLERGESRGQIALREVRANFTIDDARSLGITRLLGTFTTYHACCQARVRNIQKLADLVDGTVVRAGEQFSINQISGVRTCESGFFPAGMILAGEIVDSCGGGVSQFGTTTFNAAFFAGVQLDTWKAHSFYISRYPMGREATLNYPSPDIDVKFTNDTGHGLLVKTSHTGSSITVSIYGQSDVTKVEATRSGTFDPRGWSTQRRPNPALAPGQEVRVQSGAGGFSVRVNRFVTRLGGTVTEDVIVTTYSPQREIIEFGPGTPPPAEPQPEPEPEPSGEPEPEPSPSPSPSSSPEPEPEPSSEPPPPDPEPTPPSSPPSADA